MKEKHIRAVDFVILAVTIVSFISVLRYAQPLVIAPLNNTITTNSSVLFEFEKAELILIDDNAEFSSPEKIYAQDNLVINLKPGIYYWKVVGALPSTVRQLTIESEIELKVKKSDKKEVYEVVNAGNTKLTVDVYENGKLSGNVVLDIDESKNVSGTKFIGKENRSGNE